ncbi:hypothetical protein D3C80_1211770 [compost metagenome]
MQLCRGLENIRAALGQLRRHADGKALLWRRHRRRFQQLGLQAARRLSQQQAQGVDQLRLALFQGWQACLDRGDLGTGLSHIEGGGDTVAQAHLRQAQAVPGDLEVFPGNNQVALHGAQLDVVASGLGQQRQQHTTTVILGHFDHRIGGFDLAAHAAPEVEFPTGGKVALPEVEGRLAAVAGRVIEAFGTVARTAVTAAQVNRWGLLGSDAHA